MEQEGRRFKVVRLKKISTAFFEALNILTTALSILAAIMAANRGDSASAMLWGGWATINASIGALNIKKGLEKITTQNDEVKEQVEEGKTK